MLLSGRKETKRCDGNMYNSRATSVRRVETLGTAWRFRVMNKFWRASRMKPMTHDRSYFTA
jgi:hypothetical protein